MGLLADVIGAARLVLLPVALLMLFFLGAFVQAIILIALIGGALGVAVFNGFSQGVVNWRILLGAGAIIVVTLVIEGNQKLVVDVINFIGEALDFVYNKVTVPIWNLIASFSRYIVLIYNMGITIIRIIGRAVVDAFETEAENPPPGIPGQLRTPFLHATDVGPRGGTDTSAMVWRADTNDRAGARSGAWARGGVPMTGVHRLGDPMMVFQPDPIITAFQTFATTLTGLLELFVQLAVQVLRIILKRLGSLMHVFSELLSLSFKIVCYIVTSDVFRDLVHFFIDVMLPVLQQVWHIISDLDGWFIGEFKKLFEASIKPIEEVVDALEKSVGSVWKGVKSAGKAIGNFFEGKYFLRRRMLLGVDVRGPVHASPNAAPPHEQARHRRHLMAFAAASSSGGSGTDEWRDARRDDVLDGLEETFNCTCTFSVASGHFECKPHPDAGSMGQEAAVVAQVWLDAFEDRLTDTLLDRDSDCYDVMKQNTYRDFYQELDEFRRMTWDDCLHTATSIALTRHRHSAEEPGDVYEALRRTHQSAHDVGLYERLRDAGRQLRDGWQRTVVQSAQLRARDGGYHPRTLVTVAPSGSGSTLERISTPGSVRLGGRGRDGVRIGRRHLHQFRFIDMAYGGGRENNTAAASCGSPPSAPPPPASLRSVRRMSALHGVSVDYSDETTDYVAGVPGARPPHQRRWAYRDQSDRSHTSSRSSSGSSSSSSSSRGSGGRGSKGRGSKGRGSEGKRWERDEGGGLWIPGSETGVRDDTADDTVCMWDDRACMNAKGGRDVMQMARELGHMSDIFYASAGGMARAWRTAVAYGRDPDLMSDQPDMEQQAPWFLSDLAHLDTRLFMHELRPVLDKQRQALGLAPLPTPVELAEAAAEAAASAADDTPSESGLRDADALPSRERERERERERVRARRARAQEIREQWSGSLHAADTAAWFARVALGRETPEQAAETEAWAQHRWGASTRLWRRLDTRFHFATPNGWRYDHTHDTSGNLWLEGLTGQAPPQRAAAHRRRLLLCGDSGIAYGSLNPQNNTDLPDEPFNVAAVLDNFLDCKDDPARNFYCFPEISPYTNFSLPFLRIGIPWPWGFGAPVPPSGVQCPHLEDGAGILINLHFPGVQGTFAERTRVRLRNGAESTYLLVRLVAGVATQLFGCLLELLNPLLHLNIHVERVKMNLHDLVNPVYDVDEIEEFLAEVLCDYFLFPGSFFTFWGVVIAGGLALYILYTSDAIVPVLLLFWLFVATLVGLFVQLARLAAEQRNRSLTLKQTVAATLAVWIQVQRLNAAGISPYKHPGWRQVTDTWRGWEREREWISNPALRL